MRAALILRLSRFMDTVIITGANGEPALSIARRLCGIGIRVYAIAGTIPETSLDKDEFVPVPCDPTSPDAVISAVQAVLEKEKHIIGVIFAGQYLSDDAFEAASLEEIRLALNTRIIAPLCAARLALPSLISARGHVVVISPGKGNSEGKTLNAVADAASRAFAESLFTELRDTGVKTCHILLQNNEGAPDPATRFTTTPQSRVHAEVVADAVETVFRLRENNALTQMILRPQATRETPRIPISSEPKIRALQIVQLPPKKNFPPEEEPIPTPPYSRPDYAPAKKDRIREADDDGFSDDYVDPELRYLVKSTTQVRQQQTQKQKKIPKPPKHPPKVKSPADVPAPKGNSPKTQPEPNSQPGGKNGKQNRNRIRDPKTRNAADSARMNKPKLAEPTAQPMPFQSEKHFDTPSNAPQAHAARPKRKRTPRFSANNKGKEAKKETSSSQSNATDNASNAPK